MYFKIMAGSLSHYVWSFILFLRKRGSRDLCVVVETKICFHSHIVGTLPSYGDKRQAPR